jgi:hypothetical protein
MVQQAWHRSSRQPSYHPQDPEELKTEISALGSLILEIRNPVQGPPSRDSLTNTGTGAAFGKVWSELGATMADDASDKADVDSASEWSSEGRAFKSHRPDQLPAGFLANLMEV